jgi:hypothetical protein
VGLVSPGEDVVMIERFTRHFFPTKRLPKLSAQDGEPHVVYVGNTNFAGMLIDDLTRSFARMAKAGIHVHFHAAGKPPSSDLNEQRYYHLFEKFGPVPISSALAEFMTQFDASVILFNVDRAHDRFANALPTRFLFSLVAGIPVAVPKGLFASCEKYVNAHSIGFTYSSEAELADILSDRKRMNVLDKRAREHARHVSFEDHVHQYESLFRRALEIRSKRNKPGA